MNPDIARSAIVPAARGSHLLAQTRAAIGRAALILGLTTVGFTFLVPMLWVLTTSLKAPNEVFAHPIQWVPSDPQWDNYADVFSLITIGGRPGMMIFAANTLIIATLATLGTILSSSVVAYSLSRLRWKGRSIVFGLVLATMMLPQVITLIPLFLIFRQVGWIDTLLPLIVPAWFGGGGFAIFVMRQSFRSLPFELDEAARIDGAGSGRILWQILLPLSGPAIAAIGILTFLHHYNDFMHPMIYLSSNDKFTLSLGLTWFQGRFGDRWATMMAASALVTIPVVILFFLAQRQFIRGVQLSGLGGR